MLPHGDRRNRREVGTNRYGYAYDSIVNRLWSATNSTTNTYTANNLNQYTTILRASASSALSAREIISAHDLDGTLQGAGGVGGLLHFAVSNSSTPNSSTQQLYIPCYDNIGNVTRYLDANGNTVAQYTYDAFGKIISQSGSLADFFRHRFSTKYYDAETGLYYYGYHSSRQTVWDPRSNAIIHDIQTKLIQLGLSEALLLCVLIGATCCQSSCQMLAQIVTARF